MLIFHIYLYVFEKCMGKQKTNKAHIRKKICTYTKQSLTDLCPALSLCNNWPRFRFKKKEGIRKKFPMSVASMSR